MEVDGGLSTIRLAPMLAHINVCTDWGAVVSAHHGMLAAAYKRSDSHKVFICVISPRLQSPKKDGLSLHQAIA
jgi:hypothetical protein